MALAIPQRSRRRNKQSDAALNGRADAMSIAARAEERKNHKFPNFFVGFRIRDDAIIDNIQQLQQRITERFPELEPCMIDPRTLHVTLCVIHLADDKAIETATRLMKETMNKDAVPIFSSDPPAFDLNGLNFFGKNDILHASLDVSTSYAQSLATLAKSVYDAFAGAGFATEPFKHPYSPHVTIWKTTKDRGYIQRLNKSIKPKGRVQDALFEYLNEDEAGVMTAYIGTETPTSVELHNMKEKVADGYYRTHASASLVAESLIVDSSFTPDAIAEELGKFALSSDADSPAA